MIEATCENSRKLTPMQRARRYRKWYMLPKTIDETGLVLLREQERERAKKAKARLAALKKLKAR